MSNVIHETAPAPIGYDFRFCLSCCRGFCLDDDDACCCYLQFPEVIHAGEGIIHRRGLVQDIKVEVPEVALGAPEQEEEEERMEEDERKREEKK